MHNGRYSVGLYSIGLKILNCQVWLGSNFTTQPKNFFQPKLDWGRLIGLKFVFSKELKSFINNLLV